jgi:alpha-tubulin suppressor-like RCC1 family protein
MKCWGRNRDFQLGDGTDIDRLTPVGVLGLGSGVVAIALGGSHACALTTTGGVKCWGFSRWGQAGAFAELVTQPTEVLTLGIGVASVAANVYHTCALTTSGSAKCWGRNVEGQVGDGTFVDRSTPIDVLGLGSGAIALAPGGSNTSCAVTTGGGVKCWGENASGQLGDGTLSNRAAPVDVLGLSSGVIAVTTGNRHTCALTTAGGVKCWGENLKGQLGSGTAINSATPTDVVGLGSGVTAVITSFLHTCALTSTGGVKCWGDNQFGQLGDGTLTDRSAPVDVVGLSSGVVEIATGGFHSCAQTTSGQVKCWGFNQLGALGDGTLTDRLTPVDVLGF